jgi:hypothetical protein
MKRSQAKELMDLPGIDPGILREDLRNLILLNTYLGGRRAVLWALRRWKRKKKGALSLLDVGSGNSDLPMAIVAWARKEGIRARVVALEPHPVTAAVAREQIRDYPEIAIVRGDGVHPPFSRKAFDFVLASQLLHHFSEEEILELLRNWSNLARYELLVSDLVRHPVAYYGAWGLTRLFTRNKMTRNDAPLSVWRAFTLEEWRDLFRRAGMGEFRVFSFFPFRMLGILSVEGSP